MTLEQYFHLIIKQPIKETTMFERSKAYFQALKNSWSSLYKWDVEVTDKPLEEDYWAFEMYTGDWVDENGKVHPVKHSLLLEPHDGTWPEVVDKILDELGKHYGYNIKEQVYYSVAFPTNTPDFAGHTRLLNDEVLQQLLLAFPEVYERSEVFSQPKNVFE